MGKSSAPSGLSISRSGTTFTFKWKIPKAKYADGQGFQYATNGGWNSVSVGKTTTSKAITIGLGNFYPYSGKKTVSSIQFRVRGNSKGKPTMSAWASKAFAITAPNRPSASAEVVSWPQTKFSWSVSTAHNNAPWFTQVRYTTVLVKDSEITDGSKINWSSTLGYRSETTNANSSSSITVTDDSSQLADGHSYTRWFRVRAEGPGGASAWSYAKHVYALSNKCVVTNCDMTPISSGFNARVFFTSPFSASRPLSKCTVEYSITTPAADMECPSGASWTTGAEVTAKDGTSGAIFSIDSTVDPDECLFVRVNAEYDNKTTYGDPVLIKMDYKLTAPTITSVTTDPSLHKATIVAANNSSVPDAFMVVRYMDDTDPDGFDIAIIPNGQTTVTGVQCPSWTSNPRFGVYAAAPAGCYTVTTRADGIGSYAVDPEMVSSMTTSGGSIPAAPQNVGVTPVLPSGTVRVTWEWSWSDADSAELSWADHEDAWESTSEPSTYTITKLHASAWNISGLEAGKKWYFRVRLISTTGDAVAYGAYCDTIEVNLSSAPLVPVITLSDSVITEEGEVTASWVYSSTDGTAQAGAVIAEVTPNYVLDYELTSDVTVDDTKTYYTRSGSGTELDPYVYTEVENPVDADLGTYYEIVGATPGAFTYTEIAQTETAQQITLSAAEQGWHYGETHLLAVKTLSGSGYESDGYSDPVSVTIAEPPTCTISASSLTPVTYTTTDELGNTVTETVTALTAMPFTCTIIGAGDSGITSIAIERAEAYHVDRPDETDYNGFAGETIALDSHVGEGQFTIDNTDLLGHLDDGADYTLIATVQDSLGQSAQASIGFTVLWAHQASAPEATVTIDNDYMVAIMTPTAPADADPTDVCDIYRLSIDKPQLVYSGAAFGTTYVDPYPTVGRYGGHRFVTRTANGDVTTPDGSFAWVDTDVQLQSRYNVFDFANGRVLLELNVEISNQWRKDFKETQYLGGTVEGDWNKAVSRTATVSGVAIPGRDDDLIQSIRRLADNAGICHVRTKDGSSYAADVQVTDKYNYASGVKTYEYSLTITRVKPEELDGMTYAEWLDINEESES